MTGTPKKGWLRDCWLGRADEALGRWHQQAPAWQGVAAGYVASLSIVAALAGGISLAGPAIDCLKALAWRDAAPHEPVETGSPETGHPFPGYTIHKGW